MHGQGRRRPCPHWCPQHKSYPKPTPVARSRRNVFSSVSQQLRWRRRAGLCRLCGVGLEDCLVRGVTALDAATNTIDVTVRLCTIPVICRCRRRGRRGGWTDWRGERPCLGAAWRRQRSHYAGGHLQLPARVLLIELKLPRCPQTRALFELQENGNLKGSPTLDVGVRDEARGKIPEAATEGPLDLNSKGAASQVRTGSLKVGCSLIVTESRNSVAPRT